MDSESLFYCEFDMETDDIFAQLEELNAEQAAIDARTEQIRRAAHEAGQAAHAQKSAERAEAIAAVNDLIERFHLSLQEVFPNGSRSIYIGPWGERWDGMGPMPEWMRRAIRAGKTKADFLASERGRRADKSC